MVRVPEPKCSGSIRRPAPQRTRPRLKSKCLRLTGRDTMFDLDAPLICYGEDGPCFERLCPKCRRFLKFPESYRWRERWDGMCDFGKIECSKCGPVEPAHVGWTGDFT